MQKKNPQKTGWSRRRSELSGYETSLYRTDRSGEYIRADFSVKESRIRLMVEDRGEHVYAAVIEKGVIVSETLGGKSASAGVRSKMIKKAPVFRTMTDRAAVKLVHRHYGIVPAALVSKTKKRHTRALVFAAIGAAAAVALFLILRAFPL